MTMPDAQRPLTILIAADTYPPHVNGAAQFGYRLAKGMTGRGHNVHVLACRPDKGKSFTEFRAEGTVHRIRSHSVSHARVLPDQLPLGNQEGDQPPVRPGPAGRGAHPEPLHDRRARALRGREARRQDRGHQPLHARKPQPVPAVPAVVQGHHREDLLEGHGQGDGQGRRRDHADAAGGQGHAPACLPAEGPAAVQRHRFRSLRSTAGRSHRATCQPDGAFCGPAGGGEARGCADQGGGG